MKHKRARQRQNTVEKSKDTAAKKKTSAKATEPEKMSRKMKLAIFGISLVVLIAGFVAVLSFGDCNRTPDDTLPADEALVPIDPETGKVNILVVGLDKDGYRTDTIIIASCDLDNDCVNMLSIPRDTRMYVGGHYQKINAAYAIRQDGKMKGISGTIEAVTRLTGIPIHHYVVFECNTFREFIDALDGVDFDVPQNMNYDDPAQDLHIHLKKGFQHLDGDKAEQLVRFRRYPTGDIKRVEVQQDFLKALAEQKINLSIIAKLPELFEVWTKNIKMSFTAGDVVKYSANLKKLKSENIKAYLLPGVADSEHYGASYWIADIEEIKTLVNDTFGYDASNITIHSPDGNSASKDVKKNTTSTPKATETKEEPKKNKTDGNTTKTEDKSKTDDKGKTDDKSNDTPKTDDKDKGKDKDKQEDKQEDKSRDEDGAGDSSGGSSGGKTTDDSPKTDENDSPSEGGPKRPKANDEE